MTASEAGHFHTAFQRPVAALTINTRAVATILHPPSPFHSTAPRAVGLPCEPLRLMIESPPRMASLAAKYSCSLIPTGFPGQPYKMSLFLLQSIHGRIVALDPALPDIQLIQPCNVGA
ncbi:hypothetical protein MAP00_009192 [Monascus purpureus]|nr:hypothetical protein MAP00_009192 [Monascus purpureus]